MQDVNVELNSGTARIKKRREMARKQELKAKAATLKKTKCVWLQFLKHDCAHSDSAVVLFIVLFNDAHEQVAAGADRQAAVPCLDQPSG